MTSKLLMFQNLVIMSDNPVTNKHAKTLPGFVPASALCFDKGCCPKPAHCQLQIPSVPCCLPDLSHPIHVQLLLGVTKT